MKRILALTVPLIASVAIAGTTLAEDMGAGGSADTGMQGGAAADESVTDVIGGKTNFGTVVSAIQTSGEMADEIEGLTDASRVEIIRVSDITEGGSAGALENALARNRSEVDALRSAVKANEALSEKLRQQQVRDDDVVAAAEIDGQLVVYVR
ncbi:hypothetical protein [Chelativorans sp. AA-79]|uniref:hypothetical protein n=1 Tax=Chelativorans sp. AA-79 TaxID=3028735 RepID=UPI0023F8A1C2|nr:hypothetical protein [Chelativorans sp. AA-79]WEX11367.1 hypothetical protein PVE73_10740 [Chelativorans sp. AA-79]